MCINFDERPMGPTIFVAMVKNEKVQRYAKIFFTSLNFELYLIWPWIMIIDATHHNRIFPYIIMKSSNKSFMVRYEKKKLPKKKNRFRNFLWTPAKPEEN